MGPMMPAAWGGVMAIMAIAALIFVLLLIAAAIIAFTARSRGQTTPRGVEQTPADALRQRYAQGEITRAEYRQALLDLLQDRYARDEITLEELEARAKRLIAE